MDGIVAKQELFAKGVATDPRGVCEQAVGYSNSKASSPLS
ncbi:hypothetical protein BRCON_0460 [Candidatus Sumerlaea chitinivorans]|uniref:Uncharacterized protein n=1 Tax=Sumerlaea chitinivorans TaxID=2250252 RepID=A0A2Z4Y209_SUMC1|nr:hypothetical protein BRCON_0460 [Candidatus Sumerlaea chitinivorans]